MLVFELIALRALKFLQCQHSVTQIIYSESIRCNVKFSSFILILWHDPTELNTFVNALKCRRCGQPGVLPIKPLDLDSDWRVGMSHLESEVTICPIELLFVNQVAHPWNLVSKVSQFNKLGRYWGNSFRKWTNDQLIFFSPRIQIVFCLSSVSEP